MDLPLVNSFFLISPNWINYAQPQEVSFGDQLDANLINTEARNQNHIK